MNEKNKKLIKKGANLNSILLSFKNEAEVINLNSVTFKKSMISNLKNDKNFVSKKIIY